MSLNTCDDQAKKTKTTFPLTKASLPTSDQSEVTKKAKEKVRKEKKRKGYQGKRDRWERRDGSPVVTGVNAIQATEDQKKKRRNGQDPKKDISEITYYNCNKKGHYFRDWIEPKN